MDYKLPLFVPFLAFFVASFALASASTTITLQDPDTENLEDAEFDEDSANQDGSETSAIIDLFDGGGEAMFVKFNISDIPSGQLIETANLYLYDSYGSSNGITCARVDNTTWIEEEIDDYCGDGAACSDIWDKIAEHLDDESGTGSSGTYDFNVTVGVQADYCDGYTTSSFFINNTGPSSAALFIMNTKEHATASTHPLLNITYAPGDACPAADTCTPPASGDWTVDCNDNCTLSDNTYIGGSMNLEGSNGNFTLNGVHLSIHDLNFTASDCRMHLKSGSTFNVTSQT